MLVKAKEPCYVDGCRRRPGAEFEFNGPKLPRYLEVVGGGAYKQGKAVEVVKPSPYADMSDDQLRSRLFDYKVKVHHKAKREKLIDMLAEAERG